MATRTLKRHVLGLTFVKKVDSTPGWFKWVAIDGIYAIEIWGRVHTRPFSSIYRLDPQYKEFKDEDGYSTHTRTCLLNDLNPDGSRLDIIMAASVRAMRRHRYELGPKFDSAVNVLGKELQVGDQVHHKGMFFTIKDLTPKRDPSQGWSIWFLERDYPLWAMPEAIWTKATI